MTELMLGLKLMGGSVLVGGAAISLHTFIDKHIFGRFEFFLFVPWMATAAVSGLSPIPFLFGLWFFCHSFFL